MPSAMPMVERCAIAQWRGLPEEDRYWLNILWSSEQPFAASSLHHACVKQINLPLWRVGFPGGGGLDLLSIKMDWIGDVP